METENPDTTPRPRVPFSLKLVFSKASDNDRIDAMFNPDVKGTADPHSYVAQRYPDEFKRQVDNGHAAMLADENGKVQTLSIAWHAASISPKGPPHVYTEIGTSLTLLTGFHCAHVVVAALVLKEWLNEPPLQDIVAEILEENLPSQKVYMHTMKWERVTDAHAIQDIERLCNANVLYEANEGAPHMWLKCTKNALAAQAKVLLDFMDRGELHNKAGDTIALDLSALEDAGLTRPRLEALARGETRHSVLRALTP